MFDYFYHDIKDKFNDIETNVRDWEWCDFY